VDARGNGTVTDIVIRLIAGGVVVSAFALLGDVVRPKTFAGLFGAAPSIALATLILTTMKDGRAYATVEARSMIVGAIAFLLYASGVSWLLLMWRLPVVAVTSLSLILWFVFAFGLCHLAFGLGG
jgi:hypothetical protein